MSMVVKNNISALQTLTTLNKNSNALANSLQKVSSGMKINSAKDDASAYAISERMRVQIRSLDQANQNTQNGKSLLSTADGAISSSLDILRTLKDKAINAANDTNNEETDRQSIQKEVLQLLDQLDDNANVTYNGKILNDGQLAAIDSSETAVLKALNSSYIKNSLSMIRDEWGLSFENTTASCKEMEVILSHEGASGPLAYVSSATAGGTCVGLSLTVNMDFYDRINLQDPNGSIDDNFSNMLDRTISHEMTHAIMASNIRNFGELSGYIAEGFAEMTHGVDDTRLTYLQNGTYTFNLVTSPASPATSDYAGGFVFLRYIEHNYSGESGQGAVKQLMKNLVTFGADSNGQKAAISSVTRGDYNSFQEVVNAINAEKTRLGNDEFLKQDCGINLDNEDTGGLLGWDANHNAWRTKETTVADGGIFSGWTFPSSDSAYFGLSVTWPKDAKPADPSPMLKFHTGAKSNELNSISLGDMRARALGLRMADGGAAVSLESRGKAEAAIALFDAAIDYTLEQQTRIGAMQQRLQYNSDQLTINSENTQASESVIRDADMAKEMTEYTKNNVLLQASQSMLAQANQSSSNVLSLLQ